MFCNMFRAVFQLSIILRTFAARMKKTLTRFFTKGGFLKFAANRFAAFVFKGARTFREATMGRYNHESKVIQELREEMFGNDSMVSDAQNLRRDIMMVRHDVRTSFNKIIAELMR